MQQQIPTPNDTMRSQGDANGFETGVPPIPVDSHHLPHLNCYLGIYPCMCIYMYIYHIYTHIYNIYTPIYIYIQYIYIPIYPNFQMGIQFSEPLVLRRSRGHRIKAGSAVPLRKKPTIKRRMIRFFHLSWVKQWLIVVNNG
jgi:hypothetical protein